MTAARYNTDTAAFPRLRILHIISSVNPAHGGPIEGVKQLGAANSRAGHIIEVATLDGPDEPFIAEFPMPLHCFGPSLFKYSYTRKIVPWLRENRHRYDAIVVNGLWQFNSYSAYLALHDTDTPYYIYPHGMLDPWFQRAYPLKHIKKELYWKLIQHRVISGARAVLFTCEEERRLAREAFHPYRCREIVVNYGTSVPRIEPRQKEEFLKQFPEVAGKRCLLFISRIHEKKGCDLLVRALGNVIRELPDKARNLHLIMAGPDQVGLAAELKAIAARLGVADRITWTGMIKGDIKWGAFQCSEAFVLPSHQENFGIAVVEALACGVPVLISNQVNIWREIEEDKVGFVENDDQPGTDNLLRRWLNATEADRLQMQKQALPTFNGRFEIHAAARSMIEAISTTASASAQLGS